MENEISLETTREKQEIIRKYAIKTLAVATEFLREEMPLTVKDLKETRPQQREPGALEIYTSGLINLDRDHTLRRIEIATALIRSEAQAREEPTQ